MQDCQTLPADTISVHAVLDKEENVLQQETTVLQLGCLELYLSSGFVWFSGFCFFFFKSVFAKVMTWRRVLSRERQPFLWSWNATFLYRQE